MKRNFKVLFSIITVIAVLMSSLSGMTVSGSQNKLKEKVDLAFVIDTTGSMGPYIDNVKRNISDFAVYLEEKGIELRIGIIEYRDISADGIDSTKVHKLKGSTWHYSTKDMIETLGKLNVDGGGDTPETVIDGLGYLVDDKNTMLWSSQAYKFAVVLTDANYKVANTHGIANMNEMIDLLVKNDIKLYMESPQNVEVFIEDKDGNVVASIRNVKNTFVFDGEEYTFSYVETEGFDKEGFSFYSTASDFEEGLNAIIYIPNGGYKVVFKYLGDEDLQFGTEISTLNKDGEVTASATYFKNDKDETGHVITLDMTEKEVTPENIGSLSEKEADEAVKYNVDWEIDHRLDLTKIGESKKINITGEVASKVSWSSSSEEIVTVSEEGEVTAKGYGRAIVSATDGNIILKCIVTVSKEAKSIYVDDIIMQPGERVVIEPKFDSDDVIEEKITYEYDKNLGIIEINEYGVIIGLSEGTVQVTAKTSKGIKTKFNVTVAKRGIISVDSVIIAEGDVKIPTGEKTTIRAVLNPYNADNQKVLWYVEDSSIVSIEPDGLKCNIKALKEGETTISVVTNDGGFTDTVKISVSDSYKRVKGSTKIKSNNANLRYLSIEGVDISPDFKANVLVYDAVVDNNTTSVKVKAVAEDDSAKVRIEGADALQVGINTVNVIVTSEAGNTKKYTILVEREEKKDTDKEDEDIVKPEEEIPEAFSDIKGHWAEEQIMKLNRLGIIAGFPDGMVRPDRNLTRSELAVILVKTLGLSASGQETLEFADADEIPSWAYEYVLIAKENGIIHGYDDNTFKPHNKCNRQEMVTMLVNAFGLGESDKILPFNDKGEIHNYARGFVARANELGLVQGYPDNTFRPLNNITLAEAAAIIYKYINN
ncbi:S-layer homology domain-containing protein [Acetivibrio saccincola]|uniref:Endo-1,4-beta-xylanase A n=2 Tax=Acetivibrio saccincola TaxID=1677857 RepID=A0A2K9ELN6_9FIRM|nr:S-layer homology domain-containing protein [Acetivibrio saccincola]AUG56350.1 Endo-1,4-beta-xylanase A precursor [Acetivibrio saccincola]